MATEAQKKATAKYKAKNEKQVRFSLNKNTDADIIQFLEGVGNVNGYLKALVREDMRRDNN